MPEVLWLVYKRQCALWKDYIAKNTELYTDSGTTNAFNLTILSGEAPISYTNGMRVRFFSNFTNTGAWTIDIEGIGVKDIVTYDGDALASGQIDSNKYIEAVYDSANDRFVIANITFTDGFVKTDGSTPFTQPQAGVTPTLNTHLTTKAYVDTATNYKADKINDFQASLVANGYSKLPNGLIIQWGTSTVNAGDISGTLITFPVAFTTACFNVTGNAYTAPSSNLYNVVGSNNHTTTGQPGAAGRAARLALELVGL